MVASAKLNEEKEEVEFETAWCASLWLHQKEASGVRESDREISQMRMGN